jgi:hypothetical protein
MTVSSRSRVGLVALLAALALAAGILVATRGDADAADGYRPPKIDQSQMVLRLTDLPPGFGNSYLGEGLGADGLLCQAFSRDPGQAGTVADFARRYRAKGCIAAYESRFAIPGKEPVPPIVFSGVMALGSAAAADDAWNLVPAMLDRILIGGPPREVKTDAKIGAQRRLFHTTRAWFPYQIRGKNQRASFLAWRSGNTVAAVAAVGGSVASNDRAVAELAPRQQEHIHDPTPYTAAERSDAEVGLDDPAIDIPVYWLGRTFRPGGGLAANRLFSAHYQSEPRPEEVIGDGHLRSAEAPIGLLGIGYTNFQLETWTPETWHVFTRSRASRVVTAWKCTRTRTMSLPDRSATIFAGYARNLGTCPAKPPDRYTAWVEIGGIKVVVNPPLLGSSLFNTPYDSFEGVEAIVRSLELRPKPVY